MFQGPHLYFIWNLPTNTESPLCNHRVEWIMLSWSSDYVKLGYLTLYPRQMSPTFYSCFQFLSSWQIKLVNGLRFLLFFISNGIKIFLSLYFIDRLLVSLGLWVIYTYFVRLLFSYSTSQFTSLTYLRLTCYGWCFEKYFYRKVFKTYMEPYLYYDLNWVNPLKSFKYFITLKLLPLANKL